MQRQILWLTIGGTADDAAFTDASMTSLFRRLGEALPGLKVGGGELRGALLGEVLATLEAGKLDAARDAIRHAWETAASAGRSHVTVYCPDPSHPAVRAARGRLRHALWGINLAGTLSLTYAARNPYALWHESLHLLGAEDHYDFRDFGATCPLPTCVMQYAPDERTVGSRPFLCPGTAAILRKTCG